MNYKIINVAFPLIFLVVINGCAATGATYQDASPNKVVDADKVRLVLFRTRESSLAGARTAAIKLDGSPMQGVKYAGFTFLDTTPGLHTITVDMPDTWGKCLLTVDALLGNEYFFQIRPRVESFGFGLIPIMIAKGDQPWSPNRKDCTGTFYIERVEQSIALEKLKELKSSQ